MKMSNYTGVWTQRRHLLVESKTEDQRAGLVGLVTHEELEVSATGVSIFVFLH